MQTLCNLGVMRERVPSLAIALARRIASRRGIYDSLRNLFETELLQSYSRRGCIQRTREGAFYSLRDIGETKLQSLNMKCILRAA